MTVLLSLVSSVFVLAQSSPGFCQIENEESCQYIPFDTITINGQALTNAQEQMFCGFNGGTYHSDLSTMPSECTDVFETVIPEFSTVAAIVALGGAGIAFIFLRKGEKQ